VRISFGKLNGYAFSRVIIRLRERWAGGNRAEIADAILVRVEILGRVSEAG
jgi:hypothetical protein